MSATAVTVTATHVPVRRTGARPGSLHAALREAGGWRTACGDLLVTSPRGPVLPVPLEDAWELIEQGDPCLCRRCARVGDSVQGQP